MSAERGLRSCVGGMTALQKQVGAFNDKKDKADSELDQIIQGITLDEKL